MRKTESYVDQLHVRLKNGEYAAEYLKNCLVDPDPGVFLVALRDVAEAHGGISKLAERTGLNRESLYRMLSKVGNPSLESLDAVLGSVGLRLSIEPRAPRKAPRRTAVATRKRLPARKLSSR